MNYYELFEQESRKKRYAGTKASTMLFTMEHYKDKGMRKELEKDFEEMVRRKEHHFYFIHTEELDLYETALYDEILSRVGLNLLAKKIFDERVKINTGYDHKTIILETKGKGSGVFYERLRNDYEGRGFTWFEVDFHNRRERFAYKL